MNADLLVINCSKHGRTGPLATSVRCGMCAEEDRQELLQLRGTLSLAEEGLANYAQENEQLRANLQRATEKLQELAEECSECNGAGHTFWYPGGVKTMKECPDCHDIRLVLAICSPTPQEAKHT